MSDSSQTAPKSKIFDSRYQIFEIVGRGASSVVYRAKHVLNDDKEIALKVLLPSKGKEHNSDLLRHESLALITARHKNVIRLEDFRSVDSICYLAMEYAPESNLSNYFQKFESKLPFAQAERFFLQITEALAFLHNIGMLHRDIKPENILVINNRQVRLSDFGVATLPGQNTSAEELQKGIGTLDYMAPEIFKGSNSGPGADVYSLGLTFYELFTGVHPFKNLPMAQAFEARDQNSTIPVHLVNPDVPYHISKAISICLESDLEKRFYNAIELLNFLKNKDQAQKIYLDQTEEELVATQQPAPTPSPVQKVAPAPVAPKVLTPVAPPKESIQVSLAPQPVAQQSVVEEPVEELAIEDDPYDDWDDYQEPQVEDQAFADIAPADAIEEYYEPEAETLTSGAVQAPDAPANFNDFNYQTHPLSEQRKPFWHKLVFYSLILGICYFIYNGFIAGDSDTDIATTAETVTVKSDNSSFPTLPAGIYSGTIQGFASEGEVPLTLISLPKSEQLAVLVGMPGWQPVLIDIFNAAPDSTLTVKSNGIVLHLQGSGVDGIIKGTYKNNTNNTEGTWSVVPSKS